MHYLYGSARGVLEFCASASVDSVAVRYILPPVRMIVGFRFGRAVKKRSQSRSPSPKRRGSVSQKRNKKVRDSENDEEESEDAHDSDSEKEVSSLIHVCVRQTGRC